MYARFVNELLECAFKLISKYDNKLSAFAEHGADNNCMQEVAFLRGDDAVLFVDMYALFDGNFARATMDIDLLAQHISNDAEEMKSIFYLFCNCGKVRGICISWSC